jgi:DNA-binding SARP family transcriptional activator/tetratricopeptide (TPR) repeat protein
VADSLWFGVLGQVRVLRGDVELDAGSPQQRTVLAALLLSEGTRVSVDALADVLWEDAVPARGLTVIRTYVSRLRQTLEPGHAVSASIIRTVNGGYVMTPPAGGFDLSVFRRMSAEAEQKRTSGDLAAAAALLRDALALWHGEALAGIAGTFADTERARLMALHADTTAAHLHLRLELGEHTAIVPELRSLVERDPLDERFREMLVLALYRSGQQVEALAQYRAAREMLDDELGIEPGPALQALHERILRADSALLLMPSPHAGAPEPPVPAPKVLSQLPPRLGVFAGRGDELTHATALIDEHDPRPGAVVITGMAGVGKTAFAVHWAHQLADRFPDGQLYLNLRGFDPAGSPMTASEALRSLLELLGVAPRSMPEGVDAMAALYRGLVATRRILLVLDNARLATQVRPLLPGNAGCLVVVTSRNLLTGLLALDGARSFPLDVLTTSGARALLARRIGEQRTAAEPEAAREIATLCARLPLALAIAAARCATRPAFSLAAMVAALQGRAGRLDTLSAGDDDSAANVRDVFSWSYEALSPRAARLFRLVALHPGADVTAAAIASLAGLTRSEIEAPLSELITANLLIEQLPGSRFHCHDLLRSYADELTRRFDTPAAQSAARYRLLDYYTHTAHSSALVLNPQRQALDLVPAPPARPGTAPEVALDRQTASTWFAAEHHTLLEVSSHALAHGLPEHAWLLGWALDTYLYRSGQWQDMLTVHTTALQAAEQLGDPVRQAQSHRYVGGAYSVLGRQDEAVHHFTAALTIFRAEELLSGQADCYVSLGIAASAEGRSPDSIRHLRQALAIYQQLGDHVGHATALANLAREHGIAGEHDTAIALNDEALVRWAELGERHAQANCHDNLGYSYHHTGEHRKAVEHYQVAVETFGELGDSISEATALDRLGDAHAAAGETAAARLAWSCALAGLEPAESIDTTDLRLKLGSSVCRTSGLGRAPQF